MDNKEDATNYCYHYYQARYCTYLQYHHSRTPHTYRARSHACTVVYIVVFNKPAGYSATGQTYLTCYTTHLSQSCSNIY